MIGNIVNNGDVVLEYYAWPNMGGHVNTYSTYQTIGNNVINNTANRILANAQTTFISGNTATLSLNPDVVRSSTEME